MGRVHRFRSYQAGTSPNFRQQHRVDGVGLGACTVVHGVVVGVHAAKLWISDDCLQTLFAGLLITSAPLQ